jgi:pyruvate/2-oxoglutarate dehydrogenase complex dihydrolipoamide dehydrogenase (E3) component
MPQSEQFDVLVLGSGTGGKLIAWYMAQSGRRTAVVERRWVGGSCPNIACMPSKSEIASAKVAHLAGPMARLLVPSPSIWQRFVGASARWWNARLRSTFRFTGRAALN